MPVQSLKARRSKRLADRSEIDHIPNPDSETQSTDIISKKIRLAEHSVLEGDIPKDVPVSNGVVNGPNPTLRELVSDSSTKDLLISRTNSVDILPTPNESMLLNGSNLSSPSRPQAEKINSSLQQRRLSRGEHFVAISGSQTPKILNLDSSESNDTNRCRKNSRSPTSIVDVNRYKLKIAELTREKQTMLNATEAISEKCKLLEEQMIRQKHEIAALETILNRTKPKGRKRSRKGVWTVEDDRSCRNQYKGIKLQLDMAANHEASFLVTESRPCKTGNSHVRDWTNSSTIVSRTTAEKADIYVHLPCGSLAIPTCAMIRAAQPKLYTDRYKSTTEFVKDVTLSILDGTGGMGMSIEEKERCVSRISTYPPILAKFRTALREESNNCKQGAKSAYLKALGYEKAHLGETRDKFEMELRSKEKEWVFKRCVKDLPHGEADTMHWRLSTLSNLRSRETNCLKTITLMMDADQKAESNGVVDHMFMNKPSRIAFNIMRGYTQSGNSEESPDTSILSLARTDAWMTLALRKVKCTGKGGLRSNDSLQSYESLVLMSLDAIINDIWEDVSGLVPVELKLKLTDNILINDPFNNNLREWTIVLESPDDGYLYLLATPVYFSKNVCSWLGKIQDLQIGRARKSDERFTKINRNMAFDVIEDSDFENES